jgi:hypothetical protein
MSQNFSHTKGKIVVKDKDGNIFQVNKTDHRYLSGEFKSIHKGKKYSKETRQKMSGKKPMHNLETKQNTWVKIENIKKYLLEGWELGWYKNNKEREVQN